MIMKGSAAWKSAGAMTRCSTQPRNCEARKPSAVPNTADRSVAPKAISSDTRIDWIRRDSTSRPSSSVPSQWPGVPIGASRADRSMRVMS